MHISVGEQCVASLIQISTAIDVVRRRALPAGLQ